MNKYFVFYFLLFILIGCKSAIPASTDDNVLNSYFVGGGEEPFWGISFADESIQFTSLSTGYEKFNFPNSEPIKAMDANVKRYDFTSDDAKMSVQVVQKSCVNSMSGELSNYSLRVEIKKPTDSDSKVFNGCGNYKANYRLTDIWVLEQMKGKTVNSDDFARELPNMEIDADKQTFMGYSGCNRMVGKLFSENKILRFTNIVSTEIACIDRNRELEFLQLLQSTVNYKIENNRLLLSTNFGTQLVFKKVD